MKRFSIRLLVVVACALPSALHAQLGIGVGLASAGEDIRRASTGLTNLPSADSIRYGDVSNGLGFYASGRIKYSYGVIRLAADLSYVYFPASEITLTEVHTGGESDATFHVGASVVPIGFGLEVTTPNEYVRPYAGAQLTYSIIYKTFAYVSGDTSIDRSDVRNEWEGRNGLGVNVLAGVEFAAGDVLGIDIGARYNLTNLLSKGTDEPAFNYLQFGLAIYFGDLYKDSDERKDTGGTPR
jgi:hypothetical protein